MNSKAKSYKNTVLIALSSISNIFLSIIRNKVMAFYLGPTGIGLFGILSDFYSSIFSIGSLGISNSGVQAISEASTVSLSRVRTVYNSFNFFFSILGLIIILLVLLFAPSLSYFLIGDESLSLYLRIASLSIIFKLRSSVQSVLITGMQKINLLVRGTVLQGIFTTLSGIILVILFKEKSIPFLVLSIAVSSYIVTTVLSKQVKSELPFNLSRITIKEMSPILILGISTLWSGFLESIVSIINKSWITKAFGKEYLGFYQVAVSLTSTYIGFITASIVTDYYPRLVNTIKTNSEEVNAFVNQQINISITLIMPILMVMLVFSKFILAILFSSKFLAANDLLNYTISGTLILVVAWPIAYVFLANRATRIYILSESIGNISMLILSFVAVKVLHDFSYIGIAYLIHYVIYLLFISYLFITYFNGNFSKSNIILFSSNVLIITSIIFVKSLQNDLITYIIGSLLITIYFYFSRKEYSYIIKTILKRI